jgi:RimJ/RimL family protein N-acetyltransferase
MVLRPELPIRTARLLLRALVPTDVRALLSYHALPEVHRFLPSSAMTEREVSAKLAYGGRWSRSTLEQEGDALFLGIELQNEPDLLGDVMLHWRSEQHQVAEIGYVLNPEYSGHGYATEASRAALALAFRGLNTHRVVAYIDPRNEPSIRVAERSGLRREGLMRENKLVDGERRSEVVYAILRHEWKGD